MASVKIMRESIFYRFRLCSLHEDRSSDGKKSSPGQNFERGRAFGEGGLPRSSLPLQGWSGGHSRCIVTVHLRVLLFLIAWTVGSFSLTILFAT